MVTFRPRVLTHQARLPPRVLVNVRAMLTPKDANLGEHPISTSTGTLLGSIPVLNTLEYADLTKLAAVSFGGKRPALSEDRAWSKAELQRGFANCFWPGEGMSEGVFLDGDNKQALPLLRYLKI